MDSTEGAEVREPGEATNLPRGATSGVVATFLGVLTFGFCAVQLRSMFRRTFRSMFRSTLVPSDPCNVHFVAPRTGARIETFQTSTMRLPWMVAPRAGARIETTDQRGCILTGLLSPPVRVRRLTPKRLDSSAFVIPSSR